MVEHYNPILSAYPGLTLELSDPLLTMKPSLTSVEETLTLSTQLILALIALDRLCPSSAEKAYHE